MRKKFLSLLVLLAAVATGAEAQTETLLTTITATGVEQASYSTANVATVSFSYTAYGSSAYLANWGWWGYGWSATVNAAEGYTITKCVFYDDANRTATDSEAPFVVETTEEDKTPKVNGTPIEEYTSKGIKKIDVYGYETPAATTTVTWNSSTLSSIDIYDGESFTTDGVTLTSLDGMIDVETGMWMGNSDDASFKFSTSLGNFTRIEITGDIYVLGGSGWTETSPGAVWTGDANETTFGKFFEDVSQIVFTIGAAAPTAIENVQSDKVQATKFFRDGQLLIEKNGKIYNAQGVEVE